MTSLDSSDSAQRKRNVSFNIPGLSCTAEPRLGVVSVGESLEFSSRADTRTTGPKPFLHRRQTVLESTFLPRITETQSVRTRSRRTHVASGEAELVLVLSISSRYLQLQNQSSLLLARASENDWFQFELEFPSPHEIYKTQSFRLSFNTSVIIYTIRKTTS